MRSLARYIFLVESQNTVWQGEEGIYSTIYMNLKQLLKNNTDLNKLKPSGDIPDGRKHHAGCMVATYCLFHGGINQSGEITNDLIMFDSYDQKFTALKYFSCMIYFLI